MISMTEYFDLHKRRFDKSLSYLKPYLLPGIRVGIVGVSDFDDYIANLFPDVFFYNIIPELADNVVTSKSESEHQRVFYDVTGDCDPPMVFDLVIFTEVLEHLFENDSKIIANLGKLLVDDGILCMSVPNAASLGNRLKLLWGRNIFWSKNLMINGVYGGFGHLREYTLREVVDLIEDDFTISTLKGINEYKSRIRWISLFLPKTYANTIFVIARKRILKIKGHLSKLD